MSKITKFAEGKECTMRVPGVCNGNPETSVWGHLNSTRWGAGKGIKSNDLCGLIVCSSCHDLLDRRVKTNHDRQQVMYWAFEGHMESLTMLVKAGIIAT